jgi:lipoprotein NlpI
LDPKTTRGYLLRGITRSEIDEPAAGLADLRRHGELYPRDQDWAQLRMWIFRTRLAERAAADTGLKDYLSSRPSDLGDNWPVSIANFLLGQTSEAELFAAITTIDAKKLRGAQCEASFYAGMRRLLVDGDRKLAAECFRKAIATEARTTVEFSSAALELNALGEK